MSAFKLLKDASNKLEEELLRVSSNLFSAKIGESFEDVIAKKTRDLSLFSSKVGLLRAKSLSLAPQISQQDKDAETTINEYTELATWKLVEKQLVKALTQGRAARSIMAAPDKLLHPELVERKEYAKYDQANMEPVLQSESSFRRKITSSLAEYAYQELTLRHSDNLLREKENELAGVRARWDKELGDLRDLRASADSDKEVDGCGPLYDKLRVLVGKMELMRWLISNLIMPRTRGYDWITDPDCRLKALKMAREPITVDKFMQ